MITAYGFIASEVSGYSNSLQGNQLVFDYTKFEKRVVRLYLDYVYGIEGCLEDLELPALLELVQFVAHDGKADWSS